MPLKLSGIESFPMVDFIMISQIDALLMYTTLFVEAISIAASFDRVLSPFNHQSKAWVSSNNFFICYSIPKAFAMSSGKESKSSAIFI